MKPLLSIVVTICLVLAVRADSEKPKHAKEPVEEVKPSDPQARKERCSACASSAKLNLKNPKVLLAAVKQLPEVHTQQTFEGCLPDKGCAGIKVKDGQIIEIFGNLEAFRQAAAQNSGSEFSFHEAGSSVFQNGGPFWWAGNDSPFKNSGSSYDKISKTSTSFASTGGTVDFSGNPFLNGDFSKVSGGFGSVGGGSAGSAAAGGAGIDQSSSSFESSSFGKGQLDLSKNPFLNGAAGQFGGQSGFGAQSGFGGAGFSESTQGYVGSSPSPFSPGPTAGSNINLIQNGQKGFGYEQNVDEAFQNTGNVLGTDQGDLTQTCAGQGYVCVPRAQCNNGVVNTNGANVLQANTQKQYCNLRSEICCRIEVSSLSGTNGLAGSGLGVDSATFSGSSQGSGLFAGSQGFGSSSFGSASGFGVSNDGPKVIGGQGSSSVGSASGFGVSNIGSKTIGGQGSSSFGSSSGFGVSNIGPKANRGYGSSVGTTLAPTSPGVFGSSQTNFIETDAFASGSEFRPGAIGLKPGIPYLPPVDSSNSPSNIVPSTVYPTSFVTTPRPFSTPKPTYLPPVPSTSAPGYLPPVAESSIPREVIVPPYTEGGLLLDQTRPGTQRPFIPGPSPSEIPAGCAAALKCTPIEFCTAEGVISQTSVILTREQENYRVPLTDCKDIESGRIGKCCRDPFYTDPWPTNQLGKWVPGVFGGNDGKYVPDSKGSPTTNSRPQVTVRPPTAGQTILPVFTSSEVPPTSGRGRIPTYPTPTVTPRPFGQGQYQKQGIGQTGLVGIGQIGIGGQGKVVRPGIGVIISEGGKQITNDGVEVNQGIGTFGQDQGFDATYNQGVQTSQGVGVQTGVGYGVKQQSGIGISQGIGSGVRQSTGFGLNQGGGVGVRQGSGLGGRQGTGIGVSPGSGLGVRPGGVIAVSPAVGFGASQGGGLAVIQGGIGINQGGGVGQGVRPGVGQGGLGVRQGGGTAVRQGVGLGVAQGSGFGTGQGRTGVRQGSGLGVNQGGGLGVTQGSAFGANQGGLGIAQGGSILTGSQGFGARGAGAGIGQGGLVGQAVGFGGQGGLGASQGGFGGQTTGAGGLGGQRVGAGGLAGQRTGGGGLVGQGAGSSGFRGRGAGAGGYLGQAAGTGEINGPRGGSGVLVGQGTGAVGITGDGGFGGQGVGVGGFGAQGGVAGVQDAGVRGLRGQGNQGFTQGSGIGANQGVGIGVRQGGGLGASQNQGVGQGFGTGVKYGTGQRLVTGLGQTTINGQGQKVVGGIGYGIQNGGGFTVNQGGSYGVENEYSESTHRVFLQRYSGAGQCGLLNPQKPYGNRNELEVDFAEIPWQAMVLLQTNRSLLCGGVITRPEVVVTSASCVDGLDAKNVLIKGGEWKLGIDDEPLPFQIVQVKTIIRHPEYQRGSLKYDVAILVLAENLRFANNIQPICLPSQSDTLDAFYNGAGECIVTGWGKTVLQAHLQGSIMHALNVSLINPGECQAKLSSDYPHLLEEYDQDSCVCGQPTNPLNNICRVDIGSALACTTGDSHFVLRGVYSWDSGCQIGNQIAGFFKFDIEWYEWAIGLIESVRFAKYTKVTVGKLGTVTSVKTTQYTTGVKTTGVKEFTSEGGSGNIGQFSQDRGQVGQSGQTGLVGQGQFEQTGQSLTKVTQGFGQGQSTGQGQIGLTGQTVTKVTQGFEKGPSGGQGQFGLNGQSVTKVSQGFGQGQSTGQGQFGLTGQSVTKVSQGFGQGQSTGQGQFGLTGQSVTKVSQGFGQGQSTGQGQFGLTGQSVTKVSQGFGQGQSTGQGQFGLTGQSVTKVSQGFGQGQSTGQGQFGLTGQSVTKVSQGFGQGQSTGQGQFGLTGQSVTKVSQGFGQGQSTGQGQFGLTGQTVSKVTQGFGQAQSGGSGQFGQASAGQVSQFGGVSQVSGETKYSTGSLLLSPEIKSPVTKTVTTTFTSSGKITGGKGTGSIQGAGKDIANGFGQFSQVGGGGSEQFSQFTTGGVKGVSGSGALGGFGKFAQVSGGSNQFKVDGQIAPGLGGKATGQGFGQFSQFGSGKFTEGGLNFGSDINPITNTFSATYSEKKVFQSEPKIITYTTKPEIVTFTTKPEIVTFTTKPEYFTYTTKPEIVTFTTKPEYFTFTTKPKLVRYTTKPQYITYQTSDTITSPQVVAPDVSLNPSFTEVVGKHKHNAQCKCLEGKK